MLLSNLLPRCLVLAVVASAVRFSSHRFFAGKVREASETYARQSWLEVLTEYMVSENELSLHVVQTLNLLAVVDYTGMVIIVV